MKKVFLFIGLKIGEILMVLGLLYLPGFFFQKYIDSSINVFIASCFFWIAGFAIILILFLIYCIYDANWKLAGKILEKRKNIQ